MRTGILQKTHVLLDNIRFEHTVFALPFAYLGMVLAWQQLPTPGQFFWITVAMASARTLAMSLNRLIDREIDARNPRTAARPLVTGKARAVEVAAISVVSAAIFFVAAAMLNDLCLKLAPLAVALLVFYPYTKRFTWTCHAWLGLADALAPLGGWLAVRPELTAEAALLTLAVAAWVAGFDLIYVCQDVAVDRAQGLHSLAARFGIAASLRWSAILHVVAALALLAVGVRAGLGPLYFTGWLLACGLFLYEHSLVKPHDLSRLNMAFFNMNGYIAIVVLAFTWAELFL